MTAMWFEDRSSAIAAEIDRAVATASSDAEQAIVEFAVSPEGRLAPTPRRAGDYTPSVTIKIALKRVDPLEPLRKLLAEGWKLALDGSHNERME